MYGHLIPGIGGHRLDKLQPEHLTVSIADQVGGHYWPEPEANVDGDEEDRPAPVPAAV